MLIRARHQVVTLLDGQTSADLALALHTAAVAGALDGLPLAVRARLPRVFEELDATAREWSGRDPVPHSVPRGTAEPLMTADVPAFVTSSSDHGSVSENRIGSGEAARILRISERAVRKRAASLGGERVDGIWQFPREVVITKRRRQED